MNEQLMMSRNQLSAYNQVGYGRNISNKEKEILAKLLEEAMAGNYQAYKELNRMVLFSPRFSEYSDMVLAIKKSFNWE